MDAGAGIVATSVEFQLCIESPSAHITRTIWRAEGSLLVWNLICVPWLGVSEACYAAQDWQRLELHTYGRPLASIISCHNRPSHSSHYSAPSPMMSSR
jgi:hypothetical protein